MVLLKRTRLDRKTRGTQSTSRSSEVKAGKRPKERCVQHNFLVVFFSLLGSGRAEKEDNETKTNRERKEE